jgi:hypothetical protein
MIASTRQIVPLNSGQRIAQFSVSDSVGYQKRVQRKAH